MALTPNTTRSDVIVRYPSRRGAARSTLRRGARPSLGSRLSLARPHSPRTHSVNSIRGCQSTPTRGGTQPTLGPTSTHRDMTHHTNPHLKRCRRSRERSALGSTVELVFTRPRLLTKFRASFSIIFETELVNNFLELVNNVHPSRRWRVLLIAPAHSKQSPIWRKSSQTPIATPLNTPWQGGCPPESRKYRKYP